MNVVQKLGCLALAVVQAGAYIFRSRCGLALYLQLYHEQRVTLLKEYDKQVQKFDDYQWTVHTTWEISFKQLSPQATKFLDICAFLHHEGISEAIFQNAAANIVGYKPNMPMTDQEAQSLGMAKDFLGNFQKESRAWDIQKFLDLIIEIGSFSLIEFDEVNKVCSLHPLVHEWMVTRLSNAIMTCGCAQWILGMSVKWKFELEDYQFRQTLLPHVATVLQSGVIPFTYIASALGLLYYEGGHWDKAGQLFVQVMDTRKRVLGEEHPDTLTSMGNLASTFRNQG